MEVPVVLQASRLRDNLHEGLTVPVDCRPPNFYLQAHIPRAVNLPSFFLFRPGGGPPEQGEFEARLQTVGIKQDTWVVAYDDGASPAAARLYWVLRYYQHPRVSILDGGIANWLQAGLQLETGPTEAAHTVYEIGNPDWSLFADLTSMTAALGDENVVILDVRTAAEFQGLQVTAARNGHIPGAVNIDFADNFSRSVDGIFRLRDTTELLERYSSAGVTPEKHIYVYCQSGNRSSETCMVLENLGYPRVTNYSAGWQEWGNHPDTPVAEL